MANQGRHDWAELSQASKDYYRGQGIGPAAYNKWWSIPQLERTAIQIKAKESGYKTGMQFVAVQGQVRTRTNKRITTRTPPKEAARKLLEGTRRRDRKRGIVPKLFNFDEFSHLQWTNFMSP